MPVREAQAGGAVLLSDVVCWSVASPVQVKEGVPVVTLRVAGKGVLLLLVVAVGAVVGRG